VIARNRRVELATRLHFLALSDANRAGHAEYVGGVLARLLETNPDTLKKAIRRAVEWGLLDESSGSLCLVLPDALSHYGGNERPRYACAHHGLLNPDGSKPHRPRRRRTDQTG
jgi:hypothetical protein